ncbi:hypothetical protein B0H11DRAFT_2096491 [Mycena galericulata]|nr:hypothetical protein B0H11DRAFT_2096491 [Mycena galericulata]
MTADSEVAISQPFPQSWLETNPNQVLPRSDWNPTLSGTAFQDEYKANWAEWEAISYLIPTGNHNKVHHMSLMINYYFGVPGCIVPIAFDDDDGNVPTLIFTIAGPADEEGRKPIYILTFEQWMSGCTLHHLGDFASLSVDAGTVVPQKVEPLKDGRAKWDEAYRAQGLQSPL